MYRLSLIGLLIVLFFSACSSSTTKNDSQVLQPRDGLVKEPVFDGKIYIKMQGNPKGPVVLLVHGLGDDASAIWQETIKKLAPNYFVATLDLPGFGQSTKANELYSPKNYVKVLHHLSKTYLRQPFHLVGHSMGGAISLRYAATYPNDVQTLTLVDAAGILHRLAYTKYLVPMGLKSFSGIDSFDTNAVQSLAGLLLNRVEDIMNVDPKKLVEISALRATVLRSNPLLISGLALVLDDLSKMPAKIKAPTQIIWGEKDEIAPLRTGHVLNALIADSSLHIIPDAGHVPVRKNPDEFHALLIKSLKQDKSRPAPPEVKSQNTAICNNKNDMEFSGKIKTLTIKNCKNILVKDATIDQVIIDDSRVQLLNVDISSPTDTAVTLSNSVVMMTAGTVQGNIAIAVQSSRLDIAGTKLIGNNTAIEASSSTDVIFSLTPLSSGQQKETILHTRMKLKAGQKL